jgi:phosphotriesterase-related protein
VEKMINTVKGSIKSELLGKILFHEHIVFGFDGCTADLTLAPYRRDLVVERSVKIVELLKRYGVTTICDATPPNCARDVEAMVQVANRTGINIVCATGLYNELLSSTGYFRYHEILGRDIEREMEELFLAEIENGIGDTGIRPGYIKVGSSKGEITSYERKIFSAAVKAHKKTDLPIITHTHDGTMEKEQADLFLKLGANPAKVVIGHMCGNSDVNDHLYVLERGFYAGFDRFGQEVYLPDSVRVKMLLELLDKGYINQMLLSHDHVYNWRDREWEEYKNPAEELTEQQIMESAKLFTIIIEELEAYGVTADMLTVMFEDNPRRYLS